MFQKQRGLNRNGFAPPVTDSGAACLGLSHRVENGVDLPFLVESIDAAAYASQLVSIRLVDDDSDRGSRIRTWWWIGISIIAYNRTRIRLVMI